MGTGLYTWWKNWSTKVVNKFIDRYDRARIRNKDFTILCPNCIGGNIYHRLGLQFRTPTINLFMSQSDFIKLIHDPKTYFGQKLRFIPSDQPFPVAMLGDIKLNFNHDHVASEAAEKWYRRVVRVNWDNIYIILYEELPFSREEILSLQTIPCKRLVVLTSEKTHIDLPYVKYIKRHLGRRNERHFLDRDFFNVQTFEKHFNFVSWLNGSNRF